MMRATAFGIGLAMLGGIGIAQAQVPPNQGAGGGTQPGRPVLLLPLPNGGYSIADQNGQQGGPGQAAGVQGPGMRGMGMVHGPMGREAMREGMEHRGWMRREGGREEGGAIFAFRSPRGNIFIRCAPAEPMRACAAAAAMLIDKVASMREPQPPKGPPGGRGSGAGTPSPGASPPGTPPAASPGSSSGSSSGSGSSGSASSSGSH